MDGVRKQLAKYKGDVPVQDAIFLATKVSGVRIHLLKPDEVTIAIAYAKEQLRSRRFHNIPSNVVKEVKVASLENWARLSTPTRALVATLWTPKTGADMVLSTIASAHPKEKILELIRSILSMGESGLVSRSG